MPGLVGAAEAGRPGPGSQSQAQATEVNLHVRTREMSARGKTWISRRNLTLFINKDNGLLPRRAEQRGTRSSLQGGRALCPVAAVGNTSETRMALACCSIREGLSTLDRGQPLNIGDISSNNHGDTLEQKSQIRRTGLKPAPEPHVTCHRCMTCQRRMSTYRDLQIYTSLLTALSYTNKQTTVVSQWK